MVYQDLPEALAWLTRVFGFQEHFRYGQREFGMDGVQVFAGKAVLMLVGPRGRKSPMQLGQGTQFLTIFVEEVEDHFARSKREGATILEPLHETVYGELQYGVLGPGWASLAVFAACERFGAWGVGSGGGGASVLKGMTCCGWIMLADFFADSRTGLALLTSCGPRAFSLHMLASWLF